MTPRPRFDRATVDAVAWRLYRIAVCPEASTTARTWRRLVACDRRQARALARFVLANGFALPIVDCTDRVEYAKPKRAKGCNRG